MSIAEDLVKPISDVAQAGINKITSDKERAEQANLLLENTKEIDIKQLELNYSTNWRNPRFWLEIICVVVFAYTHLLCPILNDV